MADPFRRCFGEAGDKVVEEGAGEEVEGALFNIHKIFSVEKFFLLHVSEIQPFF